MDNATYVIFAPKAARTRMRDRLRTGMDETVRWTEHKGWRGSEFYISGPPARAREAHEALTLWLAREQFGPR